MTNRIFGIVLFAVFISCKKHDNLPNKFLGTWHDTEYIVPGKSSIKINTDSTFYYRSAGCDWRVFSKGKWRMIGDTIELNSTKIDTCYVAFPFADCIFFERQDKKPLLTIPNCEPDETKSFCLFTKEKFYIKNDSLVYRFKASSKCLDTLKIVFAKTQKLRK
ncbi:MULTISPECIES: hypothetical protein [unclassified Flavobacterium]|uniref:hypothetical protein n=1 Tax=unclassified Flavobacterium TaxID=196869 RepID=UPI0006AB99D6|nr:MULTISPECIES: hypothetical protein [unclassified Flavobacterium]KOP37445.1 hypothetical protein AKO67_14405 [Flavobacterium sp. VMW]OWU92453.1 hypothetical protein APR43_04240 [Flavobacterium sp. NLM]